MLFMKKNDQKSHDCSLLQLLQEVTSSHVMVMKTEFHHNKSNNSSLHFWSICYDSGIVLRILHPSS